MTIVDDKFLQEYRKMWTDYSREVLSVSGDLLGQGEADYDYLLGVASTLIDQPEHADMVLRICQYALSSRRVSDYGKSLARILMAAEGNHSSVALSSREKAGALSPSMSLFIAKNQSATLIPTVSAGLLQTNLFQKKFWAMLAETGDISISAPTSAGKSFIVKAWIKEYVHGMDNKFNIAYLAPTRALVAEVERNFKKSFEDESVNVTSIPTWVNTKNRNLFVLTQERLGYLFAEERRIFDLLVVDEAYKIGEGARGVLLQQVIEDFRDKSGKSRVIYLSPSIANPEELLSSNSKGHSKVFGEQVVNQNIFWVEQARAENWNISLCLSDETIEPLGPIKLHATPDNIKKRLAYVSHHFGKNTEGNIVYVNGQGEAEQVAVILSELCDEVEGNKSIDELIKLSKKLVHEKYSLNECLKSGVAFHYGNMPLTLKDQIEKAFSNGDVKFLVCTSTLVEGVNLPCKNLFVRGPRRGRDNKMEPADFWNLAGRAGRWTQDIQGNIFCIDTDRKEIWLDDSPPTTKKLVQISRSVDTYSKNVKKVCEYIENKETGKIGFDSLFSYLCFKRIRYQNENTLLDKASESDNKLIIERIDEVLLNLTINHDLILKNPGVNPHRIQDLYNYFLGRKNDYQSLIVPHPSDSNAAEGYCKIFSRINREMKTKSMGFTRGVVFANAITTVNWMLGYPSGRIISEDIKYFRKVKPEDEINIGHIIRTALEKIERVARFEAPKYLGCYCDVLEQYSDDIHGGDLYKKDDKMRLYFELGASSVTQISLMHLRLSRPLSAELVSLMVDDRMSMEAADQWLRKNRTKIETLDLPKAMLEELADKGYWS